MLTFDQLAETAPALAAPIRARLEAAGIGILGTIRRDGSPRVSPIELSLIDGGLYMGTMPGSVKAADLDRDPRCTILTPVVDRDDLGGEGKLFLRARRIADPVEARRILVAATAHIEGVDVDAFGDSPMWELLITGAAWQRVEGDAWTTISWTEGGPVRYRRREGPAGEPVEVDPPTATP